MPVLDEIDPHECRVDAAQLALDVVGEFGLVDGGDGQDVVVGKHREQLGESIVVGCGVTYHDLRRCRGTRWRSL